MNAELERIERQMAELRAQKEAILAKERELVLQQLKDQIRLYGFTAKECGFAPPTGKSFVAPKYRNPNNHDETWAGRGGKPAWFVNALARGMTLDDLKI